MRWARSVAIGAKDAYSKLIFLDPEYGTALDKLQYSNKGVDRQRARFLLPQQSDDEIISFIREAARILKPSGYLALWIDKVMLASGTDAALADGSGLEVVDVITWVKHQRNRAHGRQDRYGLAISQRLRVSSHAAKAAARRPRKTWRAKPGHPRWLDGADH